MNPSNPSDSTCAHEAQSSFPADLPSSPTPPTRRRSRLIGLIQFLRRGHLYAGLLMLPWVMLYGVTAFLFNHPTAFSDQPTVSFGKSALAGTAMEAPPAPAELAQQVIAALRERNPNSSYSLIEPEKACYTREFAFATVAADGQEISVLIDALGKGGTIRDRPAPPAKPREEKAPFAVGGRAEGGSSRPKGRKGEGVVGDRTGSHGADSIQLEQPLPERVKAALPSILEKAGYPQGEITVTSVPDLTFLLRADEKLWQATYNAQAGSVSGRAPDPEPEAPSTRRFLTRLHMAHGYPMESNARWVWAVVVDAMACIMVFWAASGLLMWWQIKSTRRIGTIVLVISIFAAAWVGLEMHEQITKAGR